MIKFLFLMSVVNCKVKYIRPHYQDLSVWMKDENNEYIGRGGIVFIKNEETGTKERFPKQHSQFANPFKIGKDGDRDTIIQKYETYLREKLSNNNDFKHDLLALKGKTLGCWCKPENCHGDVILKLIEELNT